MKLLVTTAALLTLALAAPSFAAADFKVKDEAAQKSQGSCVGQASSAGTGNGAVVGGHGTINGQPLPSSGGGSDQTTYPGSRADEVHNVQNSDC